MKKDDVTKGMAVSVGKILWKIFSIGVFGSLTVLSIRDFLKLNE